MITLTREEAQQVLDAMDAKQAIVNKATKMFGLDDGSIKSEAAELLRDRLAQPVVCARCGEVNPAEIHTCTPKEQEPVAVVGGQRKGWTYLKGRIDLAPDTPLYTAPPQREWVGLLDEELAPLPNMIKGRTVYDFARAIEAKLKEKNT